MRLSLSKCHFALSRHILGDNRTVAVTTPEHRHEPHTTTYDVELWSASERHTVEQLDDVDVALGVAEEIAALIDEHGHTPGALVVSEVVERVRQRLRGGQGA